MSNNQRNESSRREFLAVATGLGVIAGSALLAGCGGKKEEGGEKKAAGGEKKAAGAEKKAAAAGNACDDVSKLSDAEKTMRTSLKYTSKSPNPEQICKNCVLYQPAAAGAPCGGCSVVKGPIAPEGWCSSWAKKPA